MKKTRIISLTLCILLFSLALILPASAAFPEVIPGGMTVGFKFSTDGVSVVGFCDVDGSNPASTAGIKTGDRIIAADGIKIESAKQLSDIVNNSNGKEIRFSLDRGGKSYEIKLSPLFTPSESRYKTGILVRDNGAGIGTVTFIVPGSNTFAGLGHGICSSDNGQLVKIQNGDVVGVEISGIEKGSSGNPGELVGYFTESKIGAMISNTDVGVSGVFTNPPKTDGNTIPICPKCQVKSGDASVLCSLDGDEIKSYTIRIQDIDPTQTGSKCFTVKITDPKLIEKTGGIVQGMSGSPIIQNGRLVGAITHVLVNDSTSGYGIFAENMLNNMPEVK